MHFDAAHMEVMKLKGKSTKYILPTSLFIKIKSINIIIQMLCRIAKLPLSKLTIFCFEIRMTTYNFQSHLDTPLKWISLKVMQLMSYIKLKFIPKMHNDVAIVSQVSCIKIHESHYIFCPFLVWQQHSKTYTNCFIRITQ